MVSILKLLMQIITPTAFIWADAHDAFPIVSSNSNSNSNIVPPIKRNLRSSEPTILCIYSENAEGDNCSWGARGWWTTGHAAISVTRRGTTTTYGLWPDGNKEIKRQGMNDWYDKDVRTNFSEDTDRKYPYKYCETISNSQYQTLVERVNRNWQLWSFWYNCASFASEVFREVTGTDVDADDGLLGFETPCELGKSINKLNKD